MSFNIGQQDTKEIATLTQKAVQEQRTQKKHESKGQQNITRMSMEDLDKVNLKKLLQEEGITYIE